jgi:hypothetical protein
MILYHYTHREALPSIAYSGLFLGSVSHCAEEVGTGVRTALWLTSDLDPKGHGLSDYDPERGYYNKRAIRCTVKIKSTNHNLVHWPSYAKKRMTRAWYDYMDMTGGGKAKSWWLYFGIIPPEDIDIYDIENNCPVAGWPNIGGDPTLVCIGTMRFLGESALLAIQELGLLNEAAE